MNPQVIPLMKRYRHLIVKNDNTHAMEMTYGEFYKYNNLDVSSKKDIADDTPGYLVDTDINYGYGEKHKNHINKLLWFRKAEFEYIFLNNDYTNIVPYCRKISLRYHSNKDGGFYGFYSDSRNFCRFMSVKRRKDAEDVGGYLFFKLHDDEVIRKGKTFKVNLKDRLCWITNEEYEKQGFVKDENNEFILQRDEVNPEYITISLEGEEEPLSPVSVVNEKTTVNISASDVIMDDCTDACGVSFNNGRSYNYYPNEKGVSFHTMKEESFSVSLPGETENISQLMLIDMMRKIQQHHIALNGRSSNNDLMISTLLKELKEKLLIQEGETLTGIL